MKKLWFLKRVCFRHFFFLNKKKLSQLETGWLVGGGIYAALHFILFYF
jgi:hypothetical protein